MRMDISGIVTGPSTIMVSSHQILTAKTFPKVHRRHYKIHFFLIN